MLPPAGLTTRPKLRGSVGAIVLVGTIAALYFAREILIPFAFALTLTFLLTPGSGRGQPADCAVRGNALCRDATDRALVGRF